MKPDVSKLPLATTAIFVIAVVLSFFMGKDIRPEAPAASDLLPVENWIAIFGTVQPIAAFAISFVVMLIICVAIVRFATKNMLSPGRIYYPVAVYFALVLSFVQDAPHLLGVSIASLFSLLSLSLFAQSFTRTRNFGTVFKASLLAGSAYLFYRPALLFIAAVPFALWIFRRSGRESFAALVAVALPTAIYSYLYWAFGNSFGDFFSLLTNTGGLNPVNFSLTGLEKYIYLSAAVLSGIMFLLSVVGYFVSMSGMRTRPFKVYILIILITLITVPAFYPFAVPEAMMLTAPFLTLLSILFFNKNRGVIPTLLFSVLLLCALLNCLAPIINFQI